MHIYKPHTLFDRPCSRVLLYTSVRPHASRGKERKGEKMREKMVLFIIGVGTVHRGSDFKKEVVLFLSVSGTVLRDEVVLCPSVSGTVLRDLLLFIYRDLSMSLDEQ